MGYMWRDVERRAAMYGLRAKVPVPYPLKDFDLTIASRLLGLTEGWGIPYIHGELSPLVRRWPRAGTGAEPVGEPRRGRPGSGASVERAGADEIGQRYEAATDEAREARCFGSPTFAVGGELFWGDDRLEDALSWFRHGKVIR
jgi:2-hydroxychromene-2-carboxylate isomerase